MKKETMKKGFTLIELLVVISIIALLLSILMPSLSRAKELARQTVCMSNEKQLGLVTAMYAHDNDDSFNTGYDLRYEGTDDVAEANRVRGIWVFVFEPYFQDVKVMSCASASNPEKNKGPYSTWGPYQYPPGSPLAELWEGKYGSYSMNCWINNPEVVPGGIRETFFWRKTSLSKQPDNTPMFVDALWLRAYPQPTDTVPEYNGDPDKGSGNFRRPMSIVCVDRHSGKNNAIFLDQSVRKVPLKELWSLKWHTTWPDEILINDWGWLD